ncbi:molybdenum cofactor guanylyltransferase [Tunicatimonas pelagia]|uniref:molybdenum cofactor guanylyltransferase n=1 Tax=Tunicatimonas pelagia TaxID=931531 RepID=UPI0026657AC7|nr:molybdenum cofactor guanylyltransferase [Tunicatimonas pelagia]WKN45247.1 molybdenum cofactor guanylyltransferase [Tunicatimonas pelagia]
MNVSKQDIVALILCGGFSSRMGTDKGLKEEGEIPWAQQLYNQLSELKLPTYLSVRSDQQAAYASRLPDISLITDEVLTGINGPLRGMISAHRVFPQQHLLVAPCDTPRLTAEAFDLWIDTFQQQNQPHTAVVCRTGKQMQPLCGIYSQTGLANLDNLYQQGRLTDQSMYAVVEHHLNSFFLDVPNEMISLYKNFNTPQD